MARQGNEYVELKRRLTAAGLFRQDFGHYLMRFAFMAILYAIGLAVLVSGLPLWVKLLDAAYFAILFTQIGFIGHDAGHRQLLSKPRLNDMVLLCMAPFLGVSGSWWRYSHNLHHSNPNTMDVDPHTAIPALAFSQGQAESKGPWLRFITRFQAFYFYPMLLLEGIGIRLASVMHIINRKPRYAGLEMFAMVVHFGLYGLLLFSNLSVWQAFAFIGIHQGLMGFYMGSVFAPNHKGMKVIEPDSDIDFLRRQVLTTRNIKGNFLLDTWYGGLNYQVEHHLFPTMPRRNLKDAAPIVRSFCEEKGISYYETGLLESYLEVTSYLHRVVNPAKA